MLMIENFLARVVVVALIGLPSGVFAQAAPKAPEQQGRPERAPLPGPAERPNYRIERPDLPDTPAVQKAMAANLLDLPLPFDEGQRVRYFAKGEYKGYATRQGLTINFYDPNGVRIGYAKRRTQAVTNFYAEDGTLLGVKRDQRLLKRKEREWRGE
jgi:hypothetical protein